MSAWSESLLSGLLVRACHKCIFMTGRKWMSFGNPLGTFGFGGERATFVMASVRLSGLLLDLEDIPQSFCRGPASEGGGGGGPMSPVWVLKRLVSVFINACRLLSALPSLSQFGRGRLSLTLVAISFYALSLLFGPCRLSEFTLAGPQSNLWLILL